MGAATRQARLAMLLGVALLLTGCATVPLQTRPEAIPGNPAGNAGAGVLEPPRNADKFNIVDGFVEASANPENDYANARGYLSQSARKGWNPVSSVRIVDDTYDTLPSDLNARESVLDVRATQLGSLRSDGSFVPRSESIRVPIRVRKQDDGQWRIVEPADGVLITKSDFIRYYTPLRLIFHDPSLGIPVPDPRWVRTEESSDDQVRQVMDLLLAGPSESLRGAVRTSVPASAASATTVKTGSDGSLVINMSQLGELTDATRRLIATQVLLSLENINVRPLRLQAYGEPMLPNQPVLHGGDLTEGRELVEVTGNSPGLVTVEGAVHRLDNGREVPGLAGSGAYRVQSAAQSTDRSMLAMVTETDDERVALRIGPYGSPATLVKVNRARTLTRPSWGPRAKGQDASSEVWTVANRRTVYRALNRPGDAWQVQRVDATELQRHGKITELRLSRDGVRVAAVVGGKLVVGAVRRETDQISIGSVSVISGGEPRNVVGVDWQEQDRVMVATSGDITPVLRIAVDGLQEDRYDRSNLTPPLTTVTSAEGHPIVVTDQNRIWNYEDGNQGWRPIVYQPGPNVIPFYPG